MRVESKKWIAASAAVVLGSLVIGCASAQTHSVDAASDAEISAAQAWAFPVLSPPPHSPESKADPRRVFRVAGSTRSYTQAERAGDHFVPDWFPRDHPDAPQIVIQDRRKPGWPWPCGECHLVGGAGVPATASPAGLPKAYILEQFAAFRAGQRGAGAPRTTQDMADESRAVIDADLQRAADYFSRMKFKSRVKVIETATVPKMHWKFFVQVPDEGGAREPIGQRIIETPTNFGDYQYGSGRTSYIAYVPPGSITRGAAIAAKGVGATPACESCHGPNLQGVGAIPPLAGRSPTYIARELILFRTGKRSNPQAAPMVQEASQLTVKDMIAVAAFAASRKP